MKSADHTKVNASKAKANGTFANASKNPARAGPAKNPTLSIVLETTFAPATSSWVRASSGMIDAWAGRNAVPGIPTRTTKRKTYHLDAWSPAVTAAAETNKRRTRAKAIIT